MSMGRGNIPVSYSNIKLSSKPVKKIKKKKPKKK